MASKQDGYMKRCPESDIFSDNSYIPPELDGGVVKVAVIGEPSCGKTSFIRAYYDSHFMGHRYTHNGVPVYPCIHQSGNGLRKVSFFEIPSHPDFVPEKRVQHYKEADVFVFLYAVDDPSSLQKLAERWISEAAYIIDARNVPVVFVGTKLDILYDQQVIKRLILQNQSPVTMKEARQLFSLFSCDLAAIVECSVFYAEKIQIAFNTILSLVD